MLFIVDKRIPDKAKTKLKEFGEVTEFITSGITNEYLSGHPDIFFVKAKSKLIFSKQVPEDILKILDKRIELVEGKSNISTNYPYCASYNACTTDNLLIHNIKLTDSTLLEVYKESEIINVKQGFTRCSLIAIRDDAFITSDRGIAKKLSGYKKDVLFIDPENIILPGVSHGLFGGTCGFYDNKLFLIGSIKYLKEADELINFSEKYKFKIIELYDGPLFDGGSILILK